MPGRYRCLGGDSGDRLAQALALFGDDPCGLLGAVIDRHHQEAVAAAVVDVTSGSSEHGENE